MKPQQLTLKTILNKYGITIVLLAMILFLSILKPNFRTWNNLLNILTQASIYGILSLGMTFVIISKGIDLSVGSIVALSAVVAASLGQAANAANKVYPDLGALPIIVPIAAALLIGTLCGAINGSLVAYTGIPAFIATLGMTTIARGATYLYTNGKPISTLIPDFKFIGQGRFLRVPMPGWIYIVMILITWTLLSQTRFGKRTYAIGGNINAAQVSGVNVKGTLVAVYTLMGVLCGVAAIVSTGRMVSAQPGLATGYELTAIASTTIGGTSHSGGIGTITGALVGGLIMGILNNGMSLMGVSIDVQQIVKGLVVIFAVAFDILSKTKISK